MNTSNNLGLVIIEDETPARDLLKHYLQKHSTVNLLGECADGFCGLKLIKELKPDIILLDVQMPKLSGFEMLEVLDEKPEIIFTTAFDHFAIKAFDMNAVDYLLKPFSQKRFDEAITKAIKRIMEGKPNEYKIEFPEISELDNRPSLTRIVVKKGSAIKLISVDAINYIEAEDDYVMIWHTDGKALKQQTMKYYESNLPSSEFARIHRSAIVKLSQIERIEPYGKDTHIAILKNNKKLPISRTGYKTLKEKLSF